MAARTAGMDRNVTLCKDGSAKKQPSSIVSQQGFSVLLTVTSPNFDRFDRLSNALMPRFSSKCVTNVVTE